MLGILYLLAFLSLGVLGVWALQPRQGVALRVYLGLTLGMALLMALPSAVAFLIRFTALCQWIALCIMAVLAALCWVLKPDGAAPALLGEDDHPPLRLALSLLIPFCLLGLWLLFTHNIRPDADGALHVGQSTYGDLSLHLGIATGLRDASFPPEYTLLPGTLLGYPFLADAAAASLLLLGTSLQWAFIATGFVMMALVFWGFLILAWTLTRNRLATALSFVLLFVNGGLGFAYAMDGLPRDPSRFWAIFTEYYAAPANMPDLNLRWVNVLCDLLVPQRTLLGGWMLVIPALLLLYRALQTKSRALFVALGLLAGIMPMVHTHSFMALGVISAGAFVCCLWREKALPVNFLIYGGIAACMALPQLLLWTFPQTAAGGSLEFHLNWVNFEDGQLHDGYFWFWIKNVGPIYLLMAPAALNAPKDQRPLAIGALLLYVLAELFLFQPNPYDNNKLFVVAFLLMLPMVGRLLSGLWARVRDIRGVSIPAAAFLIVCLLSGGLSIVREAISDYELFDAYETEAARYLEANTQTDAVFVTGEQHNNPVAALAGRKLVCGTPTFLYYHGVDYSEQQAAVREILENPRESAALLSKHQADYIYLSSYERADFNVDEDTLGELFPVCYENAEVKVFAVSDRAKAAMDRTNMMEAATFRWQIPS